MKIAICSAEVVPFAKTGGLADVAGALPLALEKMGEEVIVVMPGYQAIRNSKFKIRPLSDGVSYAKLGTNIKAYFIEHDQYFNRPALYGTKEGDYPDNLERFSYYCKRTLDLLRQINFCADIIHVHDWQACLIPVYLKKNYAQEQFYKNTKTLLTIHNIGYQGVFTKEQFPKLGLDWGLFSIEGLEFYDKINFLKGGIIFADAINTVSETYSRQIQSKDFGFGMEGILSQRRGILFGILNGLDYAIWNPETDRYIFRNFSFSALKAKYANKEDLQKICRLPLEKLPLLGIVSRLAEQKGFDILALAIEKICRMDIQLVCLGTGDKKYHLVLEEMAKKYPKVISLHLKFDDPLAHKIYAGSDIFLMPSKYEPCGLGQMISMRYGTIPVVFKTGGLADTVTQENGFLFTRYSEQALTWAINKALQTFKDKEAWRGLIQRAMQCNFSWEESAKKYVQLYKRIRDEA